MSEEVAKEDADKRASSPKESALKPADFQHFAQFRGQRPAQQERGSKCLLTVVTLGLADTYKKCSDEFKYSLDEVPRRVLTRDAQARHNGGYDNAEHNYICRVGDTIKNDTNAATGGKSYEIIDWLGQGTFGQVVKCSTNDRTPPKALKIIKNKPAYFNQARVEVNILRRLNTEFDPENEQRIIRMLDYFVYRKHLCIVFELLIINLYDLLKQNHFKGLNMTAIRAVTKQLLQAVQCLRYASVIHCDLKPENVMLASLNPLKVKLIDFGSACLENHTLHQYIQSRFYRSPEVLLGMPYNMAIDVWSLGCISIELFIGLPVFPGQSEFDQVCRVVSMMGLPPDHMLNTGTRTKKYFRRIEESGGDSGSPGNTGERSPEDAQKDAKAPEGATAEAPADAAAGSDAGAGGDAGLNRGGSGGGSSAGPARASSGSQAQASTRASTGMSPHVASAGEDSTGPGSGVDSAAPQADGTPDVQLAPRGDDDDAEAAARRAKRKTQVWRLRTVEEYYRQERQKAPERRRYHNLTTLKDLVAFPSRGPPAVPATPEQKERLQRRMCFMQLLEGVLHMSPDERWSPMQALAHPFVNAEVEYDPNWTPPTDEPLPSVSWAPLTSTPRGTNQSGTSACSSASSAASTPPAADRRGGRGRGQPPHYGRAPPESGNRGPSSATNTPGSSPRGEPSPNRTAPGADQAGAGGQASQRRPSPWDLQSPMSEQSTGTASERMHSSHYSGSDSCGELLSRGSISQSDSSAMVGVARSTQFSDSDGCGSAGPESGKERHSKEPPQKLWGKIRPTARAELAWKPGKAGSRPEGFRKALGISEGRVAPLRAGVAGGAPAGVAQAIATAAEATKASSEESRRHDFRAPPRSQ